MATVRPRGNGSWEVILRNKAMLGSKPISFTCKDQTEAEYYGRHYDALLAQGIMPAELSEAKNEFPLLADLIRGYLRGVVVSMDDAAILNADLIKIGKVETRELTYHWAEEWISRMKRIDNLSPSTSSATIFSTSSL